VCSKHPHQQDVHHESLTQHPAEGSQEEVVDHDSHCCAGPLVEGRRRDHRIEGQRKAKWESFALVAQLHIYISDSNQWKA